MIKIALKHWIYEKCIDVFFEAITNNFLLGHKQNKFNPEGGLPITLIRRIYRYPSLIELPLDVNVSEFKSTSPL